MTTATARTNLRPAQTCSRRSRNSWKLASAVAVAEGKLESAARDVKWTEGAQALVDAVPFKYSGAARREILDALHDAGGQGKRDSCLDSLDVCQSIQDAIDVLKFAIERDDDAR